MTRLFHKFDGKKGGWLRMAKAFFWILVAAAGIFRFVLGVSWVQGSSMEPTLRDGQGVVYYRLARDYQPGDVVCVRMAYGEYYVKRVVARGGDEVELSQGQVLINGVPEAGSHPQTLGEGDSVTYPLTIPAGRYFLLGDNREQSVDSRTFGPVAKSQILGKVLLIIK